MKEITLRRWQTEAVGLGLELLKEDQSVYCVEAGVGSGKTMMSAAMFYELRRAGEVDKVVFVAPQTSVKTGAANTYALFGIHLDTQAKSERLLHSEYDGLALTYQQLQFLPLLEAYVDSRTLIVFDEPHHLEDSEKSSWYQLALSLLSAGRMMLMSGTWWREGNFAIPFARYHGGAVVVDYSYSYGQSVQDGVAAPVVFHACNGSVHWVRNGERHSVRLGLDPIKKKHEPHVLRAVLDTSGAWCRELLSAAHAKLLHLRETDPQAGGLVVARDISSARNISKILHELTGYKPPVVASDDAKSQKVIEKFKKSAAPWLVSVKMVSEGTDISRLKVLAYLTNIVTRLFFIQVMGRIVRLVPARTEAHFYFPNIPTLAAYARQVQESFYHELKPVGPGGAPPPPGDPASFELLSSEFGNIKEIPLFKYAAHSDPPKATVAEALRLECAATAQQVGKLAAMQTGIAVGSQIREVHRQANAAFGGVKQEDMTVEELTQKRDLLIEWVKSMRES